jgi:hypothetical protein
MLSPKATIFCVLATSGSGVSVGVGVGDPSIEAVVTGLLDPSLHPIRMSEMSIA